MRQLINRLGRGRSIIATTAISTILSNLFTLLMYVIFLEFGVELNLKAAVTIATVVCIIITPIIAWYMFSMVIEINDLEQEMRQLATYDSLTGLLTRRSFMQDASAIFNLALRENFSISMLIIDFDKFKQINDTYGHVIGDEVLRTFGNIVRGISRKSDLAGRLGGEEFAVLLSHSDANQAEQYARRFHEAISKAVVTDDLGNNISFTVSIGLADFPDNSVDTLDSLYHMADTAMYLAKSEGRDKTITYSMEMNGHQ